MVKLVLASKSKVRKEILDKNNIDSIVEPSNVDEDAVKLAWRTWDEEILDGQFFVIEGLLEQWFDLSYRSRDDVVDLFTEICKDQFDANVDEGMAYKTHKSMLETSTF